MTELDDLDAGVDVDLWDHKLAAEMRVLQEIFAEVVDKNARVSDNGRILDPNGRVVKDYSDAGLPAYLEFEMPAGVELLHARRERPAHQPAAGRRRLRSRRRSPWHRLRRSRIPARSADSCGPEVASAYASADPARPGDAHASYAPRRLLRRSRRRSRRLRARTTTPCGAASTWNSTRKAPRRKMR